MVSNAIKRAVAACAASTRASVVAYTALSLVTLVFALLPLAVYGKTLLCYQDATVQEYAYYAYFGHWVRDVLYQLFVAHGDVSFWSPFRGYGDDLYASFLPNLISPFSLSAVFVPMEHAELAYNVVIVLKLYTAGLMFFAYARLRRVGRTKCLLGSVCYAFAGTTVVMFLHPSFLNNMIAFPLLLAGAELVVAGRNPLAFVYGLCLAYQSPQLVMVYTLFLGAYLVYRLAFSPDAPPRGERLRTALRLAGYAALAFGVMAALLVPLLLNNMLGMDRLSIDRSVPALYPAGTYISYFLGLIGHEVLDADGYWGFGPLFLSALVLLVLRRRRHRQLLLLALAVAALVTVPFFASALNGFQYAHIRWFWMPAFAGAWITMEMLGDSEGLDGREAKVLVAAALAYGAVALLLPGGEADSSFWVCYALSLAVVGALAASSARAFELWRMTAVLVALACVGGAANLATYLSPSYQGRLYTLDDVGEAYETMSCGAPSALLRLNEDYHGLELESGDLWRYDDAVDHANNSNEFHERLGIDFYSSYYSNEVDAFHRSLALNNYSAVYYLGVNGRSSLEALLGVRYFIAPAAGGAIVPYQFDELSYAYGSWDVLTTDRWLPLAFVQDGVLARSDWDALSPIERQSALLGAAVVEDADLERPALAASGVEVRDAQGAMAALGAPEQLGYRITDPVFEPTPEDERKAARKGEDAERPTVLEPGDEAGYVARTAEGDGFVVRSGGSRVHLSFDAPAGSEVYVVFENLRYEPASPRDTYSDEEWEASSRTTRANVLWSSLTGSPQKTSEVWARAFESDAWSSTSVSSADYFMFAGNRDYAINLGSSEDSVEGAVLEFSRAGTYTYDSLTVWVQPLGAFDEAVSSLQAAEVSDFSYGHGRMTGSVDLDSDGLLFISAAHSDGWSAWVDGRPAEVVRADVAFMGIPLAAGHHDFELRFSTPHSAQGLAASACSLAVLAALMVRRGLRRRRSREG